MNKTSIILASILAALAIALAVCIAGWRNSQRQKKNWEHNYRVMQDSVRVVETKYGEVLYERGSLILEKKELEDALGISRKQVKDYEKKLGSKLAYISKLEAELKVKDTMKIIEVVHDTIANSYAGHYEDKWLSFDQKFLANPFSPSFEVYNMQMNLPLKVGLTEDYTIFATSSCPYFNVSEIEGAVVDKSQFAQKPKRFGLSVYAGIGGQYDLIHKTLGVGPQVGVGISYNFLRF